MRRRGIAPRTPHVADARAARVPEPLLVVGGDARLQVCVEIDQTNAHRVREQAPGFCPLVCVLLSLLPAAFVASVDRVSIEHDRDSAIYQGFPDHGNGVGYRHAIPAPAVSR